MNCGGSRQLLRRTMCNAEDSKSVVARQREWRFVPVPRLLCAQPHCYCGDRLIMKLDSLYGTMRDLLAGFYAGKQQKGKDVMVWSCCLKDLWTKGVDQETYSGAMQQQFCAQVLE